MKKTIKINFKNFLPEFDKENNFLTNLLRKRYSVIITDKPDYLFCSVFEKKTIANTTISQLRKKIPMIFFFLDKGYLAILSLTNQREVRIFYTGENIRPDMNRYDWAFSFDLDESIKHLRHMRLPFYVWDMLDMKKPLANKELDFNKIKKEKTRFCNFIYSNNVPFRNDFFKKLSFYKKVDSFGKCCNNMGPLPIKAEATYKPLKLLEKYKFTIAFENSSYPGYTTEKIMEPMLANSIPIYWGNPKIGEDFNTKSFLNYFDFKNEEELINKIIEIDNNDKLYEEYLKQPWFKNNKPNKYFDEEIIFKRLKEIFG